MTAMVGTMLLLARKPEQLEFRPFDLCVLARQEEVEIRERLRGRPVTFSSLLPDRLTVLGSPELAAMVLHNLLDTHVAIPNRAAFCWSSVRMKCF